MLPCLLLQSWVSCCYLCFIFHCNMIEFLRMHILWIYHPFALLPKLHGAWQGKEMFVIDNTFAASLLLVSNPVMLSRRMFHCMFLFRTFNQRINMKHVYSQFWTKYNSILEACKLQHAVGSWTTERFWSREWGWKWVEDNAWTELAINGWQYLVGIFRMTHGNLCNIFQIFK